MGKVEVQRFSVRLDESASGSSTRANEVISVSLKLFEYGFGVAFGVE